MEIEVLQSLALVFFASAVAVFLLNKINVHPLVGFLLSGVIIGPNGLGFMEDSRLIEIMAEIGVVLLLFTIGIEFSLSRLVRIRRAVIGGGTAQVLLTIAFTAIVSYALTFDIRQSIFFGFLMALSSTAIVMKILSENGEMDTPHGRTMIGILVFQDLCVVPFMLLTPSLSGGEIHIFDIASRMLVAGLIVALVILSARWIIPSLLHHVVRTRSRELFITSIILLCIGTALLTSKLGLSLALGAFLAGLVISESEYSHQATSDILPFKDSFMGLFFVSVGMLLDIRFLTNNCGMILASVAVIFGIKVVTGAVSGLLVGNQPRTAIQGSLGLAQIGEFSFVLAIAGKSENIIPEDLYQLFLSSSIITMAATPFLLKYSSTVSAWMTSRHLFKKIRRLKEISEHAALPQKRHGHVVIVGFGVNGRNLARVLKSAEVPYAALEMNADTVKHMKKKGEPIYYGDGTGVEILHKLGIQSARLLVVAISDPASTRRIIAIARKEAPNLFIIARTRYIAEVDDLKALGADEVIPEEFETSIEIFSRVLHKFNVPNNMIKEMVNEVRRDNYRALRSVDLPKKKLFDKGDLIPEIEIDGYRIPEGSDMVGKSIEELQIRKQTGVTIVAVRRGDEVFSNPSPDFDFMAGDVVLYTGVRECMIKAGEFCKGHLDQSSF